MIKRDIKLELREVPAHLSLRDIKRHDRLYSITAVIRDSIVCDRNINSVISRPCRRGNDNESRTSEDTIKRIRWSMTTSR